MTCEKLPIDLSRLLIDELATILLYSTPVDYRTNRVVLRRIRAPREPYVLPTSFLGAEAAFGRSSTRFDPDKESFHIPLLLSTSRNGKSMRYVVQLSDFRGSIDVRFRRIGDERVVDDWRAPPCSPHEEQLGKDELDHIAEYLAGYLAGRGESLAQTAPSFLHLIRSNLIIYGKRDAEGIFERTFATTESFDEFASALERELRDELKRKELEQVCSLLDEIDNKNRSDARPTVDA